MFKIGLTFVCTQVWISNYALSMRVLFFYLFESILIINDSFLAMVKNISANGSNLVVGLMLYVS